MFGSECGEYQPNIQTAWDALRLLAHVIEPRRSRGRENAEWNRLQLRKIDLHWHDRHEGASRLLADGVASGTHSYRVLLKHGQWYTLGSSSVLTPAAARELARQVLGDLAHGIDPREKKRRAAAATFDTFLEKHYEPWALIHLRSAPSFLHRLKQNFSPLFGGKPLNEITTCVTPSHRSSFSAASTSILCASCSDIRTSA